MLQSGACHNQVDLTVSFPIQSTLSRPTNQGSACSSHHGSLEEVPILKDSTLLSRLPAPPAADKRRNPELVHLLPSEKPG
ncbi:hypothetical protein AXF42_Ash018022 [Apostasia shenzhenica]|uniref:Uncharacterized protein n=1 Tax=Apostasia shenzhenica TaxID=1088818 RepID=A0A2I0AVH7_9ASPA|nr:hypothetical protein AXF42_Ash018022 [Apostasia shenzhenica]